MGITEQTDAVAVVVSEETGIISLARNGRIVRHLDEQALVVLLQNLLQPEPSGTAPSVAPDQGQNHRRQGVSRSRPLAKSNGQPSRGLVDAIGTVVLSLVLAVIVWVNAIYQVDKPSEDWFPELVRIEFINVPAGSGAAQRSPGLCQDSGQGL